MIKVIMFDLLGVLVSYDRVAHFGHMSKELGVGESRLAEVLVPLWELVDCGTLTSQEMKRIATAKLVVSRYKLDKVVNFRMFRVNRELEALMKRLRKRYDIVLLTNISRGAYLLAARNGLDRGAYRKAFVSGYMKCRKPQPEAYRYALDRMRISPDEAVFVDDNANNVNGAKALGINAIRFTGNAQLSKDLSRCGVIL